MLRLTRWSSVRDTVGSQLITSWDEWISILTAGVEVPPRPIEDRAYQAWKRDHLPAWSPAVFVPVHSEALLKRAEEKGRASARGRDGRAASEAEREDAGQRRRGAAVRGERCEEAVGEEGGRITALVIESDGKQSIADGLERWGGYRLFLHTSTAHTVESPHWRLIVALSREVTAGEHRKLLAYAWEKHGRGNLGEREKDPSRLWYMPVRGCEVVNQEGEVLDVESIIRQSADAPQGEVRGGYGSPQGQGDGQVRDIQGQAANHIKRDREARYDREPGLLSRSNGSGAGGSDLSIENRGGVHDGSRVDAQATKARNQAPRASLFDRAIEYARKLDPAISGELGGTRTLEAAGKLRARFDLSEEDTLSILWSEWNQRCEPPWSEPELRRKVSEAYRMARFAYDPREPETKPKQQLQPGTKPLPDKDIPHIQVQVGRIYEAVDSAIDALRADDSIYVRDFRLVHIIESTELDVDEKRLGRGHFIASGTPMIRMLHRPTLVERLSMFAYWEQWDARIKPEGSDKDTPKGALKRVDPPESVVSSVIARERWPGLRPITSIIEAPSLRADGTVIDSPGYDKATGCYFKPRIEFKPVKEQPTQADAFNALLMLQDIFADFPYQKPEEAYVPIAALLSLLARPAILGPVPCFIFDANAAGSGKTLQTDVISIIATGRRIERLNFPSDDNEETEKRLAGLAVRGCSLFTWDNLSPDKPFGGSCLEGVLTDYPTHTFRVLGKDDTIARTWNAVMCASGNQILLGSDDIRRRSYVARILTPLENPERRDASSYKHPERANKLPAYVLEHRAELVHAALTILRGYMHAKEKDTTGQEDRSLVMASFEEWSAIVPSAIVWAGGPDIVATCRPISQETEPPEKRCIRVLYGAWPRLIDVFNPGQNYLKVSSILNGLYPLERVRGQAAPDEFDDVRGAIDELTKTTGGKKPDGNSLGTVFDRWRDRAVGANTLRLMKSDRKHGSRWVLE